MSIVKQAIAELEREIAQRQKVVAALRTLEPPTTGGKVTVKKVKWTPEMRAAQAKRATRMWKNRRAKKPAK